MAGAIVGLGLTLLVALVLVERRERIPTTPVKPAAEYEQSAPNIVVVMTDDQAIDTMRAMPRTRRLVGGHGVTFANSVVSFPLCCPSRATFLTGQYAHNHGVRDNGGPNGGYQALDEHETLPVWLSRTGFRTGFVGKFLNGYGKVDRAREVPPGWTDWYGLPSTAKQRPFDFELNENGKLVTYDDGEYKTEVLEDKAVSFIRDHAPGKRPFFLWVATDAPHKDAGVDVGAERNPEPAPRDRKRFDDRKPPRKQSVDEKDVSDKPRSVQRRPRLDDETRAEIDKVYVSQLESLVAVDRLVKRLVRELRSAGELDDTLVLFTSDHGFLRGHHRIDSGKSRVYEEAIRVPLLVRGPGIPRGVTEDAVVANVDLAPTILELTGATPSVEVDGRSLVPVARGEGPEERAVLLEVFERPVGRFTGVRTRHYTYAHYEGGTHELYDLERDPEQLESVHNDPRYAEVRA
ncbi:MAG TPA: sulfatase, partial [Solirubrobacterales bacterium]|nr:sulfatase [Solirubrobacterales bacterium]